MSEPSQTNPSIPYKIFISYRRTDSQATADHIYEWLGRAFGREKIFKDVDSIPPGFEFAPYIKHVMRQCRVVLVVLGPSWPSVLATEGAYSGQPRLADPEDYVRIETEQALTLAPVDAAGQPAGDVWLIPLLVQNAQIQMLHPEALPTSLHHLSARTAWNVRFDPDFTRDMQRLIAHMASWMGVTANDPLGNGATPASLRPPDDVDEVLAISTPQIRAAFTAQNWPQVVRQAKALPRQTSADRVPTEVYQMLGRAQMATGDYAGAKAAWDTVRQREPRDVAALRAAAEARVALDTPDELAEALALLEVALMLSNGHAQQQMALLRMYAHILSKLAQRENEATAQTHWRELLRVSDEGLALVGVQDVSWLTTKLKALNSLGRDAEALEVVRQLTALPNTTVPHWLTRARLAWKLAGEMTTDEVCTSLDAASRLAPHDAAVITARRKLLAILPPNRFPPRLAQLGFTVEERGGVAVITPPICAVPAGEFLMGSDKLRDPQAYDDELPQRHVKLATYSIARFPVTVAEYACFVEAEHHRQPQWWPNQLQKLDHPVTYVSWDDAVAYAVWLAQLTRQPWRLPTEAEWEKAARWDSRAGAARLYPWGDVFDPSRANTRESGKGGTTAVGSYPSGASPYGAEDMAGNVWEWTHSLYRSFPYTGMGGQSTEHRVLRGGSWDSNARYTRAAHRLDNRPDGLNLNFHGFRLVLAAGL